MDIYGTEGDIWDRAGYIGGYIRIEQRWIYMGQMWIFGACEYIFDIVFGYNSKEN